MNADMIFAPWSPEEVSALNRWQATPTVHPFTCASDHDGDRDLIARVDGWHCPTCGYKQTWAHRMMLNTPPTTVRA
jgi:hypothetical protein